MFLIRTISPSCFPSNLLQDARSASSHQRRLKPSPSMRLQWSGEGGDGGCEQRQRCLRGQAFNNDYKLERATGPDRLQLWGHPPLWSDPRHRMRRRYNYAPACGKECPETPQWRPGCGRHRGAKEVPAHSPCVTATMRKGQDIKRWIKEKEKENTRVLYFIFHSISELCEGFQSCLKHSQWCHR